MPLHPANQRPDPQARVARQRRRLWMILFSVFILVSVLSLIYVATGLSRETPARDLVGLRERLAPEATWTMRLRPFPDMLKAWVAEPEGAKPDGQALPRLFRRIESNAYPVAYVMLLESDGTTADAADPEWVAVVGLRRSQRLYAEPLQRALEQARAALGSGTAVTGAGEGRLVLASSDAVLKRVEAEWQAVGDAAEAPTGEGMAPLTYQGPAARLTPFVDEQLADAIPAWPRNEDELQALSVALFWSEAPSMAEAEVELMVTGPTTAIRALAKAAGTAAPAEVGEEATLRWTLRGLSPLPPPAGVDGTDGQAPDVEDPALEIVAGPEWFS